MCAGTPGVDMWTEGGGPDEDFGIVPGHAYSVIAAKQHKNTRLLNIRNPWGQFEWGGKWGDNDRESWTQDFIEAINPDFDTADGSFWMAYEEFFTYFESLTICKVENWRELRLKGKFIKVEEAESGNDQVISQFYYSFHLDRATHIELGVHQEDDRILGADKRPYLDLSVVILKRSDDGTLSVAGISDSVSKREIEKGFDLGAGHYIVVPRTTGALLQKISTDRTPVPIRIVKDGHKIINPKAYSTFCDLFRKIDLKLDSVLTARELNYFGECVNEPYFKDLTQEAFETREFDNISCTYEGGKQYYFI
jgi:hypothetical protein